MKLCSYEFVFCRFHVDKMSSAHVYLRLHKGQTIDDISEGVLEDCAQLVKANSIQGKCSALLLLYQHHYHFLYYSQSIFLPFSYQRLKDRLFIWDLWPAWRLWILHVCSTSWTVPDGYLIFCRVPMSIISIGNKINNIDVVYTPWGNLKKIASMDVGQVGFYNSKMASLFPSFIFCCTHILVFTSCWNYCLSNLLFFFSELGSYLILTDCFFLTMYPGSHRESWETA